MEKELNKIREDRAKLRLEVINYLIIIYYINFYIFILYKIEKRRWIIIRRFDERIGNKERKRNKK